MGRRRDHKVKAIVREFRDDEGQSVVLLSTSATRQRTGRWIHHGSSKLFLNREDASLTGIVLTVIGYTNT